MDRRYYQGSVPIYIGTLNILHCGLLQIQKHQNVEFQREDYY